MDKHILMDHVYNFVKSHLDELNDTPEFLGFKSKKDMLNCIKNNEEDAIWAIQELMVWGLKKDYTKELIAGNMQDEYESAVYKIDDIYFTCCGNEFKQVKLTTKTIQVFEEV